MMWLLVIVAFSLDGGPDLAFSPPIVEPVTDLQHCHDLARQTAKDAANQAGTSIDFVYECHPPKADEPTS